MKGHLMHDVLPWFGWALAGILISVLSQACNPSKAQK